MGIKTKYHQSPIVYIEPIIPLSSEQEKKLKEGDGQSNPNEYKQINSSTGLAVSYYKILENTEKIKDLLFEDKVAIPLIKGGKPANLDVSYKRDGKIYYVESKIYDSHGNDAAHCHNSKCVTNLKESSKQTTESAVEQRRHADRQVPQYPCRTGLFSKAD